MRINCASLGRVTLGALIVVGACAVPAHAQSSVGHTFAGPVLVRSLGNRDYAWQAGAGAEKLIGPYGVGAEVDFIGFPEYHKTDSGGSSSAPWMGLLVFGFNGSYYFGPPSIDRRTRPFATAGMTVPLGNGLYPTLDFSGGFDWWATRRTGFRFEVREQLPVMLTFRFGVAFR